MVDKQFFYKTAREQGLLNKLNQLQIESIDTIINYWDSNGHTDFRWLAYIFATVKHETANTMLPIEEYGKGKGRPYGRKIKHSGIKYTTPDKLYYGRGYVQLTWYENYDLLGRLLGIDLLATPELTLNNSVATKILFEGMTKGASSFGDFTGKCLEMYFTTKVEDWEGARKIINGTDKKELIAGYGKKFLKCLRKI